MGGETRLPWARAVCALAWLVTGGCSGGSGVGVDAGTDAPVDAATPGITPPAAPSLGPCPDGWVEHASPRGTVSCEPFAEGARACAGATAQLPGDADCRPVGAPCPTGTFPEDLPADRPLRFVLAGATGGDGSVDAPFGRIRDATLAALPDTVVVLGKGTYDEVVTLPASVTLRGACAAETVLVSSVATSTAGVVNVAGAGVTVRDLRIGPSARAGLWVRGAGVTAEVSGVVVEGARIAGVEVWEGARLVARDLVVRDTGSRPSDRDFGRGLNVEVGGHAEVYGGAFERNRSSGLFVQIDSSARFEDVVVRDTRPVEADLSFGRGLYALSRSTVTMARSVLEGNRDFGVMAEGLETSVELDQVVIRGTLPRQDSANFGRAVQAQFGAALTARRLLAEGNREFCVAVLDPDSQLTLEDAVVRDCRPSDLTPGQGRGLTVQDGAAATVTRIAIEDVHEAGVAVSGASLTLSDATIRGVLAQPSDGAFGRGVSVQSGGALDARRVRVEDTHEVGFFANEPGTRVVAEDLVVLRTRSQPLLLVGGRGIEVDREATLVLRRGLVDESRGVGVFAAVGGRVTLEDVVVDRTEPEECVSTTCPDTAFGMGLLSMAPGSLIEATRFEIARAAVCGVMVGPGGEVTLRDGRVLGSPIGSCIQNEGFPPERLSDAVEYVDNDINFDATTLPVPDPFGAL